MRLLEPCLRQRCLARRLSSRSNRPLPRRLSRSTRCARSERTRKRSNIAIMAAVGDVVVVMATTADTGGMVAATIEMAPLFSAVWPPELSSVVRSPTARRASTPTDIALSGRGPMILRRAHISDTMDSVIPVRKTS